MVECGSVTAPGQWVEELGTRRRGESGRHGDPGAPGPSGAAGMRDPNSSISAAGSRPAAFLDSFDPRMEEFGTRRRRRGAATPARLGTARHGSAGTARRRGPRYPGTARRPGHGAVRQAAQAMQVVAMGRASSRPGAIGAPHTRQTP